MVSIVQNVIMVFAMMVTPSMLIEEDPLGLHCKLCLAKLGFASESISSLG